MTCFHGKKKSIVYIIGYSIIDSAPLDALTQNIPTLLERFCSSKTPEPWNIPKGVMRGQEMLYMTTMESINNILAYCSPNLEDQDKALHAYSVET